jgi:regulator of protease activity HflC (stomatin/prohibitin superfamily)
MIMIPIFVLVAFITTIAYLIRCYVVVKTGEHVIVERHGVFSRTLGPGLHYLEFTESPVMVNWFYQTERRDGRFESAHIPSTLVTYDPPPLQALTRDRLEVNSR